MLRCMCVVHYFLNNRTARSSDAIVFALAGLTRKLPLYVISSFKALRIRKCITGDQVNGGLNRWSG